MRNIILSLHSNRVSEIGKIPTRLKNSQKSGTRRERKIGKNWLNSGKLGAKIIYILFTCSDATEYDKWQCMLDW